MSRSKGDFEANRRCVACHDEDNDPNFDFAAYWPQVQHNGLDDYANPRIFQGLDAMRKAAATKP
jgi:hypothetical protein